MKVPIHCFKNSLGRWLVSCELFYIPLVIACFAFAPKARAVSPPPDGGYPNWNTAEGTNALFNLTTGIYNTALGGQALFSVRTGGYNTGVGLNALYFNTANYNTATGAFALFKNTTGARNTANGVNALRFNQTGISNTAIGTNALYVNSASNNTAVGDSALFSNTSGFNNTATGDYALLTSSTGIDNTAIGALALEENTGGDNTAMGYGALFLSTTGNGNTALGSGAGVGVTTASNVICIGSRGANLDNSCYIGNIYGQLIDPSTAAIVGIDATGKVGTLGISSRRFKRDIKPIDEASEAILALKPVTFEYKSDTKRTAQFGLIAEEVAEVNPDLVVRDKEGEPYTVRYDAVNAMLLNEFLKEHRKVEEQNCRIQKQEVTITEVKSKAARQEETIALQQREIAALTIGLKEQASEIQRVSARLAAASPFLRTAGGLKAGRSTRQVVLNNR